MLLEIKDNVALLIGMTQVVSYLVRGLGRWLMRNGYYYPQSLLSHFQLPVNVGTAYIKLRGIHACSSVQFLNSWEKRNL